MMLIAGKYFGTRTERIEPRPGDTWAAFDSTSATLLIERPDAPPYTLEVKLAGRDLADRSDFPAEGEYIAFEMSVEARAANGRAYLTYKAWRRAPEVEALFSSVRS